MTSNINTYSSSDYFTINHKFTGTARFFSKYAILFYIEGEDKEDRDIVEALKTILLSCVVLLAFKNTLTRFGF